MRDLTPGTLAGILNCASRTIAKEIDCGQLTGYRLELGGNGKRKARPRRVPLDKLIVYLMQKTPEFGNQVFANLVTWLLTKEGVRKKDLQNRAELLRALPKILEEQGWTDAQRQLDKRLGNVRADTKLLVIGGNDLVRLKLELPESRVRTEWVGDPYHAGQLVKTYRPHVIVFDTRLGRWDGLDLAKELHDDLPNAVLIGLKPEDEADAGPNGCQHVFKRPPDFPAIAKCVLELGRRKEAQEEVPHEEQPVVRQPDVLPMTAAAS